MITVDIIAVGGLKEKYLDQGCKEYIKRLSRYCKINIYEISESYLNEKASEKEILICLEKETEQISKKFVSGSKKIALCIEGSQKNSEKLAEYFSKQSIDGASHFQFIIGSSYGLSEKIKKESDLKLSISSMTFPHQLMRLIILEQIYRAFSINNNSKYHK